jgi:alkanesulfonate monooxygenase SsuD/methylene tetrahydromethanopterin reductase-like flavin-dependent oxidoreductase (luciferase family)
MELATIAELFPGRLVAGVGHGMPGWMRSLGAWPDSPLTLLEEYVTTLRALLRGEEVDVDGRYVKAAGLSLAHPLTDVPPVLVGVRGPRSLALAGRVADGTVLAEPAAPEYVRAAVEQIAATRPHRLVTYDVAAVDDDPARARADARAALTWLGEPDSAPHVRPLPFADELVALRARSADQHEFAAALPDAWVDRLAVVGTPDDVRTAVAARHEAGATTVVLIPVGDDPTAALARLAQARPAG